jgi:sugar lactone lactonase YvrE
MTFVLFCCSSSLVSQNYLNLPESAVYDSINNRYLISNFGNGSIVQIDSTGTQSIYLSNVQSSGGLHIVDSVLYMVCGVYGIKGYDLITGEIVFNVTISGFPNINDITSDNFGNLYVSFPAGNTIYKINIASGQSWVFTNQGLSVPNGLFFDEENNRLLLVSYRPNSPIQAVSLIDSTVSLVTYTGKHNLDGLTRDAEGNYYFSSWQTNSVYVIDGDFLNSPELFSSHNDDPADIYFDIENNLLVVPLFFTSQVEFIPGPVNYSSENVISQTSDFINVYNYPNPFNPSTTIFFNLTTENTEYTELSIYNLKGQKIRTLVSEVLPTGEHSIVWNGEDETGKQVGSSLYFYILKVNSKIEAVKKCLLMK